MINKFNISIQQLDQMNQSTADEVMDKIKRMIFSSNSQPPQVQQIKWGNLKLRYPVIECIWYNSEAFLIVKGWSGSDVMMVVFEFDTQNQDIGQMLLK